MDLAKQALSELYPDLVERRTIFVRYSAKFKGFNANVRYDDKKILFSLGKDWQDCSPDILKGLFQHLFIKMFNNKSKNKELKFVNTFELDLYKKFVSNLGRYAKIEDSEPLLEQSFNRINEKYFFGLLNRPNLMFGKDSFRKLGHYEYQTDTVVISGILKDDLEVLDYVMHHELIHKKLGSKINMSGRSVHHSKEFKDLEKLYDDKDAEKKLKVLIRKKRLKKIFSFI